MVIIKNTHIEMHIGGIFPFLRANRRYFLMKTKLIRSLKGEYIYALMTPCRPNFDFL